MTMTDKRDHHPDRPEGAGEPDRPLVFRGVPDDLSGLGLDQPQAPAVDLVGLRRRVLATGVITLALFVSAAFVLTLVGANDLFVLLAAAVVYLVVTRPLMRPVRAMTGLRRRLAYQAFLAGQQEGEPPT